MYFYSSIFPEQRILAKGASFGLPLKGAVLLKAAQVKSAHHSELRQGGRGRFLHQTWLQKSQYSRFFLTVFSLQPNHLSTYRCFTIFDSNLTGFLFAFQVHRSVDKSFYYRLLKEPV